MEIVLYAALVIIAAVAVLYLVRQVGFWLRIIIWSRFDSRKMRLRLKLVSLGWEEKTDILGHRFIKNSIPNADGNSWELWITSYTPANANPQPELQIKSTLPEAEWDGEYNEEYDLVPKKSIAGKCKITIDKERFGWFSMFAVASVRSGSIFIKDNKTIDHNLQEITTNGSTMTVSITSDKYSHIVEFEYDISGIDGVYELLGIKT
jgi:hypothetical protein